MSFINSREKKDVRMQFLVTESNKHALKAQAQKENVSMNEIVNRLIRDNIKGVLDRYEIQTDNEG